MCEIDEAEDVDYVRCPADRAHKVDEVDEFDEVDEADEIEQSD